MGRRTDRPSPSTVLIARFSALGDVAMTIPVVYSACRRHPGVRFVMVTRPAMTAMFVNPPSNLTLVGADVKGEYAGAGGLRRLVARLVDEYHPDIFADLHNVVRTRVMSVFLALRGIPTVRLFKPRANRRALTRSRNKVMLPLTGQRDFYREVFYKAGVAAEPRFEGLFSGHSTAPAELFAGVTAPKSPGERWIGIAPFAAHKGKIYPIGMMEKVVERLQADADAGQKLRIFVFGGGKEETDILDAWERRYPSVTSLAGRNHGFMVELALFNHLDVMLSMDSANMHLAAIAGAPTLSIWGATHPYCGFKAWRQSDDDTIQIPLECRPCSVFGDGPCRRDDYLCLSGIRPETVYERITRVKRK